MCLITGTVALATGTTFAALGTALASSVGVTSVSTGVAAAVGIGATVAADLAITGAIAGGVMGTVGSVQQAEQQKQMADFQAEQEAENARLARKEAEAIKVQGDQEKQQLRQKMLLQRSSARTGFAASGVVLGAGSTLDYEADIADAYDMDSRNLDYDIRSRQWQVRVGAVNAMDQSRMYRRQADAASSSKATSLLGGVFNTVGDTASTAISVAGSAKTLLGKK
jgi:hypothetical protein